MITAFCLLLSGFDIPVGFDAALVHSVLQF